MRLVAIALAALMVGCTGEPERALVDPPSGGGWAECPPSASRAIAVSFRANATEDTAGREAGLHRLDARTFLWVWASYEDTLREDRITRVNPIDVARDGAGLVHICTRVDVATPIDVDGEPRSYVVAARFEAREPLPPGPVRFVVNWVAGCPCDPLPRGNATALFDE